jgi:hypothetical protein
MSERYAEELKEDLKLGLNLIMSIRIDKMIFQKRYLL